MRVVPFENEAVNECWIATVTVFPTKRSMAKIADSAHAEAGRCLKEVDWQTALEYVPTASRTFAMIMAPRPSARW